MRVSGSLFTFSEMSASVADNTFQPLDLPFTNSSFIATVADASGSLSIYPLNGPSNRCPSWDELLAKPTGSIDVLRVVLTISDGVLTANAFGGTAPYNYIFTCSPSGPCSDFSIAHPYQSGLGGYATTEVTTTAYSGTTYTFNCLVSDDLGHSAFSNNVVVGPCLVPETNILMADRNTKMLADIKPGDLLFDSLVTSFQRYVVSELYSINNGLLKASAGHIHILINGNLVQSNMLKTGEYLTDKNNNPVEITSIEVLKGEFEVINISTDTATYIANGIRTHNKFACPG